MYRNKIDFATVTAIGEMFLGGAVIIFSFLEIVIAGSLDPQWYFRLTSWFAILVSFDLIRTGRQRLLEMEKDK